MCNSLLCIVKQTGERSLALYLHDDLQLSTSAAASLASVWPIGFVVSVVCFGALFDKARCLRPAQSASLCILADVSVVLVGNSAVGKVRLVFGMTGASTAAMLLIGAWRREEGAEASTGEIVGKTALLFVTAVGIGLPYYVPIGVYSVRFGKERAGVVSAYIDALSAVATAAFLWALSGTVDAGWSRAWLQLGGIGLVMTCSTTQFVRYLYGAKQGSKYQDQELRPLRAVSSDDER